MLTRLRFVSAAALFGCLVAVPAFSQDLAPSVGTSGQAPANLAYIEGSVDLVHDGVAETATAPSLLLDGDVVRTGNGRAEIVFADGTIVHLDRDGQLELLSPERLRLRAGRIVV